MDTNLVENSTEELANQPKRSLVKAGGWVAALLLIFGLLLSSSWLSLLTMSELPEEDTRSKLYADYNPWEYVSFQPVDQAIINAIENDRGEEIGDPEEAPEGDWFWETPIPGEETPVAITPAAPSTPASSSTAIVSPSETPTSTPVDTPIPTATNTAAPTNTPLPSATFTPKPTTPPPPTATFTPKPTTPPPPTATFTPKPTKTPPPINSCANITLKALSTNSTQSRWIIKNTNSSPITIESVTFSWPAANGQLTTITLGSNTIWTGLAAPISVTIGPGDWTGGGLSTSANNLLIFEFADSAANTGYDLTITFVGGCVKNASR